MTQETQPLEQVRGDLNNSTTPRPVRPVLGTGQTGRSCRTLYTISSNGLGSFFETKSSPRCRHVDEDPICGFRGSAKPG